MNNMIRPNDWEDPVVLPEAVAPKRVLVCFDGSHTSERALAWASLLAGATAAELVVIVAFEQPLTMRGRGALYVESIREELESEATELAREAVGVLTGQGLNARGVVVKGEVAHAILDTADDEGCDLIIVGRQGLSAELRGVSGSIDRIRERLHGSVTDKVVRHASMQVLVVG
jgi:nucleotide-binding universal stress UspA family protein